MSTHSRHTYLGYLLTAAGLLVFAVALFPRDDAVASAVRAFSHGVGTRYFTQELLAFVRPFGKGEVALLLAFGLGLCGSRRRAFHIILAVILAGILVWPFKLGVARERPNRSNTESFPSGDTATIAAFCAPLASASPWGAALGSLATGAVAAGRIYDGKHFPSDVLTGAAVGVLSAALAAGLLRRRSPRIPRRWFLIAIGGILAFDLVKLPWARALPNALSAFATWGPLLAFLFFVRLWPAWRRLRRRRRLTLSRPVVLACTTALVLWIYFSLTTASTLWDRDEPRFSRATVEMVQSGNYLYPTFNGSLRPDKPILIYWLMSGPVRLFGPSEFACRFVAPVATIGAGLLTAWIATTLAGPLAGLLALIILALSPLMVVSGTAATTDALLLFCMTGAIAVFLLSRQCGFRRWHAAPMALFLGAALLTKGPVGLLPILIIAVAIAVMGRGPLRLRSYIPWLLAAVAVAAAFFLAWGIPANIATNGQFGAKGLGHHVVERAVTPLESHGGKSFLFAFAYLPVIAVAFFPWTLYLPLAFAQRSSGPASPDASANPPIGRIMLSWALPVIVVMSLVATKLPHYILPAFPALAIGAAVGIARARKEGPAPHLVPLAWLGLVLFVAVGLALGLTLILAPWFLPLFGLRVAATGMGMLFLAMTAVGARQFVKGRHDNVLAALITGMTLILLSAALFLLPAVENFKISPRLADRIAALSDAGAPVSTCGYGEPSLNFYLNRGVIESLDESQLADWARRPGPGVLVITPSKLKPVAGTFQGERFQRLGNIGGFNYSQGRWMTVVVFARDNRVPKQTQ